MAIGLTWPTAAHLGERVPGAGRTDLWNSLWGLWFVPHELTAGRLPWRTGLLGWPDGGVLVVADPLNALLAAPVVVTLGPAVAYTLLVLGHVVFSAMAAHALARAVFRSEPAGWIAGVAYGCAPVLVSAIHNGTSESLCGGWLALSCLLTLQAAREGGARRQALAGLGLMLAGLGNWYSGLCAWMFWGATLVVGVGAEGWRARGRRLALTAALGVALTAPVAGLMKAGSTQPDNLVGIKHTRELMSVRRTVGVADPRGWWMVGDWRSPDFRKVSRYGEEFIHCHYLGWSLLALSALGAALGRGRGEGRGALLLAGAAGFVLAMGPVVAVDGQPLILRGRLAVPLPYFLVEQLPPFSSLSLLYRLSMMPSLALAVLAGGAVVGRPRLAPLAALLILLDLRLAAPTRGLPDTESAVVPEPIVWLADAPEGAVMNFPVVGGRGYLYEQTVHHKPLAAGLNFPNNRPARAVWGAMLDAADAGLEGEAFQQAVERVARREGIRYLVVHIDPMARPDMHDAAVVAVKRWMPAAQEAPGIRVHQLW
ncbi:MAG: hypothetical protein H6739_25165 [Alphaproteobacteria bacterium]|nr:hypothetical protein [Alphaproteobacteria bacterium]